jgi:hypothetical protein
MFTNFKKIVLMLFSLYLITACPALFAEAENDTTQPPNPIYIRTGNGWLGLIALGDQYLEFEIKSTEIDFHDATHILLPQNVGLAIGFTEKNEFFKGGDLLSDHAKWVLNYWRAHADKAESKNRGDLKGSRTDVRVTEMKLTKNKNEHMTAYITAFATKSGVVVFLFSPIHSDFDPKVKEIINSMKLVNKTLDADEIKRLSLSQIQSTE